jgi:ABC-2 type transport system permease protein
VDRLVALVALRFKLELRALSRARESVAGLLMMIPGMLLFAGVGSFFAFFGLSHLEQARPDWTLPVVSALATLVGFFWALSPLLAGVALTETHDVSRLLDFPIPARTLVLSSFIANLVQLTTLAMLPVALASSLALAHAPIQLPLVMIGVLLSLVLTLSVAQAVGLALQGLGRNRRWSDAALFLGIGFGFLVSLAPALLLAGGRGPVLFVLRLVTDGDLCAWSPFAWGMRAAVHAGRSDVFGFVSASLSSLLFTIGAVAFSALLLDGMHRRELVTSGPGARSGPARMILPGALGALIEKDVRTGWRDPAIRAAFFIGLAGPMVFLFFLSRAHGGWSGTPLLLLATFVGLSPFGANAFGLERRGISLLMSFPLARWKVLVGKNLGALLLRAPGTLVVLAAGALIAPVEYVPAAGVVAFVTLLLSAAMDNYMSILFPLPVPPPGGNPYASASGGRGFGAAMLGAVMLGFVVLLCAPFAFLVWLPVLMEAPALWLLTLPAAILGALALYAMLVLGAERLMVRREPELLERILGEV